MVENRPLNACMYCAVSRCRRGQEMSIFNEKETAALLEGWRGAKFYTLAGFGMINAQLLGMQH
jgi:hypothetical protein